MSDDLRIAVIVHDNGQVEARRLNDNVASGEFLVGYRGVDKEIVGLFERWLRLGDRDWREDEIRVFGSHLHKCLFPPEVWDWVEPQILEEDRIRLELIFPADSEYARMSAVPWEFLYRPTDGANEGYFLCSRYNLILSRYIPVPRGESRTIPPDKPRVLVVASDPDPDDIGAVLWEEVAATIKEICEQRKFPYSQLENPTLDDFRAALRERDSRPDLVHIIGHGDFDAEQGEATLALREQLAAWIGSTTGV